MNPPVAIKRRERDAVLQSLQAGLVPKQGLHLIQVGRKSEVSALLQDLERVCDDGASFRIVVGRFGSGKSFFLNLVRNLAFQKKLVVAQADFSMERRLYASGGEARGLYSELMRNMATKAQPDGGALPSVLSTWVSQVQHAVMSTGGTPEDVDRRIGEDLRDLQNHIGGFEFAEVVRAFYRGYVEKNEALQAAALRWLRGEYTTKTEARTDLGVRRIVDDDSFYDGLKLMAAFVRKAGFGGLLVNLDEMVVLSHRLPSSRARQANYEALLTLLNDSFQGNSRGLGFIFAGTDECLEDKRRGLFSYEALRSRLAENTLARQQGLVDLSGPVVRLQPLTPEDLFVLLKNIAFVHASGDSAKVVVCDEGIVATLRQANERLGADYFRTPRDVVRSFIGLLNLIDQNPGKTWQDVLGADVFQKPSAPMSAEEEVANGAAPPPDDADDDLTAFKL
ncbi:MAG: ATP-binding protein [Chthoniobacter sp.]|uniref:ATP-binding protein n=1 Tax=Chthoniobacter sp. TaxID=2510640 RepID=UPI0032ACEE04